jgi:hypothetical protein
MVMFGLCIIFPGQAKAAPVLLAQFSSNSGGSSSRGTVGDIRFVTFGLIYDIPPDFQSFPNGSEVCVGCQLAIPIASVSGFGSFDFDATNSPEFTTLVARLTNGTDEILWSLTFLLNASGAVLDGSGGGGNFESFAFGASPDLVGRQIDFIRLTVKNFSLSEQACCGGGGYEYRSELMWQFFGEGMKKWIAEAKPKFTCPAKSAIAVCVLS